MWGLPHVSQIDLTNLPTHDRKSVRKSVISLVPSALGIGLKPLEWRGCPRTYFKVSRLHHTCQNTGTLPHQVICCQNITHFNCTSIYTQQAQCPTLSAWESLNYLWFSTGIRKILSKKHLNTYNDQFGCVVQSIASALFWVIQWKIMNNLWIYCNILL